MDFENRVAIVTGGTRGIGMAISKALLTAKCRVAINFKNNVDAANHMRVSLSSLGKVEGKDFIIIQGDVSKFNTAKGLADETIEQFGKIDLLVNNAGVVRDRTTKKMSEVEWDDVISNDLKTVFNCSQNVLNPMIENNYGRIVSISSVIGETGNFGQSNYSAAKAGVIGFSKSLALEVVNKGITVNAIAPGFTETEMTWAIPEETRNNILLKIPMKRFAKPEEIAYVALFLLSEEAAYITGQVININGGLYM